MTEMKKPLEGKIALVTGGSRGIGAAIAKRLAKDGAIVAITYNASPNRAEEVVADIEAFGGKAIAIKADAGNPDAVRAAVDAVAKVNGRVDILVNNAGISINASIEDYKFEDYERMISVNVTSMFVACQQAIKYMQFGGRIINIGSMMMRLASFPTASVYVLTKGAVAGFTRGLARDLGPKGITVNAVHPGPTDTDMNPADGPVANIVGPNMAIGRYGRPDEVASVVAFLASSEAAYVTGSDMIADGGLTA